MYPREDLYAWIRNSEKMIEDGHPKAVQLYAEWESIMNSNPQLTDIDIEAILTYIRAME